MADLIRVSLVGGMPSGEEWSVNPVFAVGGDFGEEISSSQAQQIAQGIAQLAFPSDLRNCMTPQTTFVGARVEARSVTGALESLGEYALGTATAGQATVGHTFQVSLVSSLRTTTAGASGRGRLYWPATGIPVTLTTLRPSAAFIGAVTTSVAAYLRSIANAAEVVLSGGVTPVVWSRKLNALFPVTTVQIGDVLDVQRRRRDNLVESVSSAPIP